MSIVLDEYEWAEQAISSRSYGDDPVAGLTMIAKYYYSIGFPQKDIKPKLETFLLSCDPSVRIVKWDNTLEYITKNVGKYEIVRIDSIPITKTELLRIASLQKKQTRRLAFTLLCLSKYWDRVFAANNHWVNTKDGEITKMANINTSIKRQSEMYSELVNAGMIKLSKRVDNLNVCVLFSDDEEQEMQVQDFRNLGYQYMAHYDDGFFQCVNCGIVDKYSKEKMSAVHPGRAPRYCRACAVEVKMKQSIDSVMRRRVLQQK